MSPRVGLFVCTTPRSGSGVLCSSLWGTGLCGRPDEYLATGTSREYTEMWGVGADRDRYLAAALDYGTTPNGVFAMKVHWQHMEHGNPFVAKVPRAHFIWLSRRDHVRQAVSHYVAMRTGRFRSRDAVPATPVAVPFDRAEIDRHVADIVRAEQGWTAYFASLGVAFTRLWYEDHIDEGLSATVIALLRAVGETVPDGLVIASDYERQANSASDDLAARYRAATAGR
jgi:LPS sulfotransferase NodH